MIRSVWSIALLALGAVAFLPAYGGPYAGLVVAAVLAAALALPVGIVALGRRLRVTPWVVAGATTLVVLLSALTVLRADEPAVSDGTWRTTPAGEALGPLADSVAHLLTGPRPAPVEPVYLVPVAVVVALVSLGVALALGRSRSRRRPALVAPLVGAAALYAAALLVTGGSGDAHGLLAASIVATCALGWALLDGDAGPVADRPVPELGRAPARVRRTWPTLLTSGGLAAALAATAVVGAAATSGEAFEPREHVEPPSVDLPTGHPFSQLPAWVAQGDTELFRVRPTGPGAALPERLALVVLPDFDGATWRADLALRPVGAVAAPALPAGDRTGLLDMEVTVTGLADAVHGVGDWLPSAGALREVSVPAVHDVDTGSVLGTSAERTYRLVAVVDQPEDAVLATAPVPGGPEVERYLRVPRLPEDLADLALVATEDAATPWAAVVALRDVVREGRELAPDAVTGSSYARLQEFLGAERSDGGQVGSAEQFAGALAVLARAAGVPSRVVVGFTLPDGGSADQDGVVTVRGRDAHAWPEVYLAGAGWVAVDPSPAHRSDDSGREAGTREVPDAEERATPEEAPAEGVDEPAPAPEVAAGGSLVTTLLLAVAWVSGGAALVAALVLGVLLVRRGRLAVRRRRAGAPGAWQHVEDALVLAGRPVPVHDTAPVVAASLGADAVGLAQRAEADAFAPVPHARADDARAPRRASPGDRPGDDWAVATRCARELRRGATWGRRLRWWVDPAPLRRASRAHRRADVPAPVPPADPAPGRVPVSAGRS